MKGGAATSLDVELLKSRPPPLMHSSQKIPQRFLFSMHKFFKLILVFFLFHPLLAEWHAIVLVFLTNNLDVKPVSPIRVANLNLIGLVSPLWAVQTMNFHGTQALCSGFHS